METYKSTFKSIEDAKKYINIKTNKILKKTEIEKLIRYYQDLIENSDLEEHKKTILFRNTRFRKNEGR